MGSLCSGDARSQEMPVAALTTVACAGAAFCTTPYRKPQKEQATGNPFGFLLPRDCKEEAMTGNCTPFDPAKECLIMQGESVSLFRKQHIFQGKAQQTSHNHGPAQGGQP
jgi:hypothetical protein